MAIVEAKDKLDFNELILHIYVVGGKGGNGEGILILFQYQDKILKTISVDCCQALVNGKKCNLLDSLLTHYGVTHIDCFVWTHPHEDHTNGLENLIEKYYRKGSIGIIPKQIYGADNDIVKMGPVSKSVLKKFNAKFDKKRLVSIDCLCSEKRKVFSFTLEDSLTGQQKNIILYCLTPMAYLLDDKRRKQQKISNSLLNDISLSLILDVDGYCFFFGGDATDKVLKDADTKSLYGCRWIKIPHHASKTAMNVVQYFNHQVDSAVTTSFLTQHLPVNDVLDKYKNITQQIYVTQKQKEDNAPFGMVSYQYTFKDLGVQLKITRHGNAYKYK